MIETIIGAALGASFANQGLYNKYDNLNRKCDKLADAVSNVDNKCGVIASQMVKGFNSVMKSLNRLEIMQFLQLTNAPTENGRITHTYEDGRKLSYVVDSQDILEYQADGQLAYKNGEECPVVTKSFVESGVEFKIVHDKGERYIRAEALGYDGNGKGHKCVSEGVQDVETAKRMLDKATADLDYYKKLLPVLKNELARMQSFGAIRRWWNSEQIKAVKECVKRCERYMRHNVNAVNLLTIHYQSCIDFSKKFPQAYGVLTGFWKCRIAYERAERTAICNGTLPLLAMRSPVDGRHFKYDDRNLRFKWNDSSWRTYDEQINNWYFLSVDNSRFEADVKPNGRLKITFRK